MLDQNDLKNLLTLISKVPITGQEALTVALLQQKLSDLLKKDVDSVGETAKKSDTGGVPESNGGATSKASFVLD